jgi:hypothetical protein
MEKGALKLDNLFFVTAGMSAPSATNRIIPENALSTSSLGPVTLKGEWGQVIVPKNEKGSKASGINFFEIFWYKIGIIKIGLEEVQKHNGLLQDLDICSRKA